MLPILPLLPPQNLLLLQKVTAAVFASHYPVNFAVNFRALPALPLVVLDRGAGAAQHGPQRRAG